MPHRRRVLVAAAAALPLAARAQARVPVVGYLSWNAGADRTLEPLRAALRALGYVEGRNLTLDVRWASGSADLAARHAAELAVRPADVIVVWSTSAALAAQQATRTVPIVMLVADPLAGGLVQSLARPGGNLTGVTTINAELTPKRLELVREILPGLGRIGFVGMRGNPVTPVAQSEAEVAAGRLGIRVISAVIDRPEEMERAFATLRRESVGAVLVQPILTAGVEASRRTTELAMRHRLAWISDFRLAAESGALASYGPSIDEVAQSVARYVDRILNGAKPGDLPILQPTQFELVINLATARALGITVPPAVLARADEVIE